MPSLKEGAEALRLAICRFQRALPVRVLTANACPLLLTPKSWSLTRIGEYSSRCPALYRQRIEKGGLTAGASRYRVRCGLSPYIGQSIVPETGVGASLVIVQGA